MKNAHSRRLLQIIYRRLYKTFGPQHWWPAKQPFEVMVGAILTQNTAWGNVEKAIANLKRAKCISARKLKGIPPSRLAALIRPSGYYNIKAKRLKSFLDFFSARYQCNLARMRREPLARLRQGLLATKGIGPETADSILLYALGKPIFVVDAYTRRILSRHGILDGKADYETVQNIFMQKLKPSVKLFNEYHALLVRLGKDYCKKKPLCNLCPLKGL
jgi:endonuclease-3 related protein